MSGPQGPITIRYDYITMGCTASYRESRDITGSDSDQVKERAAAMAKAIGAVDFEAVGIHNLKSEWEKMFGLTDDSKGYVFADTVFPSDTVTKKPKFWQFWKK
jgi:hypothetical protein